MHLDMTQVDPLITNYLDYWDSQIIPAQETQAPQKRGKGRPNTGRTTRTVRVPNDLDLDKAIKMYYDWLPILEHYRDVAAAWPDSVRNEKLIKLLQELGI